MAMGARRAEGNVTYDQECRYSVEEYINILLQTLYPPILVGSGEKTSKTIHGFSHGREWFEQGSGFAQICIIVVAAHGRSRPG